MEYLELLGMTVDAKDMCNMVRSHSGGSGAACISQQAVKLINCNSVS